CIGPYIIALVARWRVSICGVDRWATGHERMRLRRTAIVLQRAQERVLTLDVSALRSANEEVRGGSDQIKREFTRHGTVCKAVVGRVQPDPIATRVVRDQRILCSERRTGGNVQPTAYAIPR